MARLTAQQLISAYPDRFALGIDAAKKVAVSRRAYDRVVACGMGGSALAADIANTFLDLSPDIVVHRDYDLPNDADPKSLVITTSHSGNTEETLSSFDAARDKKRTVIAITTGGTLATRAKKFKVPCVVLPNDGPPRYSLAEQIGALCTVLASAGVINDMSEELIDAASRIAQDKGIEQSAARIVAGCANKIPLIYSSSQFGALAREWKIKFNETSKCAAFYNVFPEANHNELEALTDGANRFCFIFLTDPADDPRRTRRAQLVGSMAKKAGASVVDVEMHGSSKLEKILHTVWLGDWVTLLAAKEHGVDPLVVPTIEDFKRQL
jgi:glucose/mannose-6-phosphate isomerase